LGFYRTLYFFVIFHRGGVFRKEGESVVYVNGIKHTHKVTDFDKWCFFEAVGVVKGNLRTYGEESPNSIGEYKALK